MEGIGDWPNFAPRVGSAEKKHAEIACLDGKFRFFLFKQDLSHPMIVNDDCLNFNLRV